MLADDHCSTTINIWVIAIQILACYPSDFHTTRSTYAIQIKNIIDHYLQFATNYVTLIPLE